MMPVRRFSPLSPEEGWARDPRQSIQIQPPRAVALRVAFQRQASLQRAQAVTRRRPTAVLTLGAAVVLIGRAIAAPPSNETTPSQPLELAGLHNVFQVTDKLYTGSGPERDEGFASLVKLGVRTVISVDGARPDVELARKHRLRYVHLPIGYDGVPREQALRIAKAIRDLPGPIYLHCHHGKHRAPAAAAAAHLCIEPSCTAAQAVEEMRRAGTDPRYQGLYATVRDFDRPDSAEIDDAPSDFPEVSPVGGLAAAMVDIDQTWERLLAVQYAGWTAPAKHPDLDPAHEALQLVEHYREAQRLRELDGRPPGLRRQLAEAERSAADLEAALREAGDDAARRERAEAAFAASRKSCASCHASFRDVPQ